MLNTAGLIQRFNLSSFTRRLLTGAFWNTLGGVASRGLNIFVVVLIARILGKKSFGEYTIILNTMIMFQVFAEFGLGLTATKYVAQFRYAEPEKAGRIIALSTASAIAFGFLITILSYVSSPWLAEHTLAQPSLAPLLRASTIMLLVSALSGAQLGALAGFEDFRTVARVNLMAAVVGGPPRLIGAYLRGLEGAVWGMIAAAILSCLVIHFALLSKCNEERIGFKLANCWKECGVLFSFSLPAVLAGMLCIPTVWLCSAMLVNQPGGYAELGVYGAASQWRNLILFLPWMIGQVSIPMLSAQDFHQNKREIFAILKSLLYTYCLATIPILAVACALSPFIMDFYGPDYSGTWPVLVLILFATSLQVIQAPVVKFMEATGRMWTNLIISMVWTITVLCFSQQFIQYGALGLCIALVIAFAIEGLLLFAYGVKVLWEPGTNTQLQISLGKE